MQNVLWDFSGPTRVAPVGLCGDPMQIDDTIRKSIVFLGILDDAGAFVPYGTGFIVGWQGDDGNGLAFPYIVTAKHVIEQMKDSTRPLMGRINVRGGGAQTGVIEGDHWFDHPTIPNCDIAVSNFMPSPETFDVLALRLPWMVLTTEYIAKKNIGIGEEVFTVGLLVSHFGRNRNLPIIRTGTIAAMPEEPIDLGTKLGEQEVYLIESRSIGGLSGSPVFLHTEPLRIIDNRLQFADGTQLREYLLGVNIGLFETKAHGDKLSTDTLDRREHFLEAMSAGIAVVVPIQRVIEIIRDTPALKEGRQMALKKKDRETGFVPTAALKW